jgi:hypothetical protein
MLQRQPYLPRFMAGGPGNPLGARAMYLADTVYRIHGTNAPETIGKHVSSGCIRMLNEDVIDLYDRTHLGTKVVVLPMSRPLALSALPRAAIDYSSVRWNRALVQVFTEGAPPARGASADERRVRPHSFRTFGANYENQHDNVASFKSFKLDIIRQRHER